MSACRPRQRRARSPRPNAYVPHKPKHQLLHRTMTYTPSPSRRPVVARRARPALHPVALAAMLALTGTGAHERATRGMHARVRRTAES